MDFRPEHYFQAAIQRMEQARHLYRQGRSFALSIYVGGLAVECMLRAFKLRRDPSFDERHNLLRLFAASGMLRVDYQKLYAKGFTDEQIENHLHTLRVAVNAITALWANNYRYASEERLLAHLKRATGYQKTKGNYLKARALEFLDSAQQFINKEGVAVVLLRKVRRILTEQFPPPAKVSLEDHDGIIGYVQSERFKRMRTTDRQDLISDILAAHLEPKELRQVQVIVGVAPEEEIGLVDGD